MGIRQRFIDLISKGEAPDPDELIDLIVVRAPSGPMTLARLREDGFDAQGRETFNVGTKLTSDYQILIPRHQYQRASEHLKTIL